MLESVSSLLISMRGNISSRVCYGDTYVWGMPLLPLWHYNIYCRLEIKIVKNSIFISSVYNFAIPFWPFYFLLIWFSLRIVYGHVIGLSSLYPACASTAHLLGLGEGDNSHLDHGVSFANFLVGNCKCQNRD